MPTKIEWCDETWSPIMGCTKISAGCQNCYALELIKRFKGRKGWPCDDRVTLFPERLEQPFKWKKPKRIFVCSMSDLFHEDVPISFVGWVMDTIEQNQQHTFKLLTKRPRRMLDFFREVGSWCGKSAPPPNLSLGVSISTQADADRLIPLLLQTPAAKKFISAEPLLEEIDIKKYLEAGSICGCGMRRGTPSGCTPDGWIRCNEGLRTIQHVITGAETGKRARPMNPAWARSLRDQCKSSNVPFFFKKMSYGAPTPDDLQIREFTK